MLWPLSRDDDNWWSMFHRWMIYYHVLTLSLDDDNRQSMNHTLGICYHALTVVMRRCQLTEHVSSKGLNNHALTVVMRRWQLAEQVSYLREKCSVSCHRLMTTVRAWTFIPKVWIMLCQLSSSHDIGQSMIVYHTFMKPSPTVGFVLWQRTEHCDIPLMYETCTVRCHRLMTTFRAWWYIIRVWNMLRQLS